MASRKKAENGDQVMQAMSHAGTAVPEEVVDVTGPVPGAGNGEEVAPARKERKPREVTYTVVGTSADSGLDDHCGEFPSFRRAMEWALSSKKLLSRFYSEVRIVQTRVKERLKLS